jgi:uncharacterized surface protein with fasciclin (FAS1) repeats
MATRRGPRNRDISTPRIQREKTKMIIMRFAAALSAVAAVSLGACSKADEPTATNEVLLENDVALGDTAMTGDGGAPVLVGGAEMLPTKTIVETASQSADHTTLVAAVKAGGLAETLSGPGPFKVFAPTNAAFAKLPAGTVEGLLKPAAKADLTKVLTYHVVPGAMTAAQLSAAIKSGNGKAELTTVQGAKLTATASGDSINLTDAKGGTATVTQADVTQSNGVVHVVDAVLLP